MEAFGGHVEEVASYELVGGEAHDLGQADAVVLVAEADLGSIEGDEAALADGTAVEVAPEIVEDGGGVLVALAHMDVPALVPELANELVNMGRSPAVGQSQSAALCEPQETVEELATKQPFEGLRREEVSSTAAAPVTLSVHTPCGHQAVHMGMKGQLLAPCVECDDGPRQRSQVPGSGCENEQRLTCGEEEQLP
jgi:hypothetical protein